MRTFEHFPKEAKCPICGTSDDKECFLMAIDGTTKDGICEAAPTHVFCITENFNNFMMNKEVGVLYMRLKNPVRAAGEGEGLPDPSDTSKGLVCEGCGCFGTWETMGGTFAVSYNKILCRKCAEGRAGKGEG